MSKEIDQGKICNTCKEFKHYSNFTIAKKSKDGYDWSCKPCKREKAINYIHSDKGKDTREKYYKKNKNKFVEIKREKRHQEKEDSIQKVSARLLVGKAVRLGYMNKPESSKDWWNRYEFHHTNYNKPFLGVWVKGVEHRKIHKGEQCPPVTNYTNQVIRSIIDEFGISENDLKEFLRYGQSKNQRINWNKNSAGRELERV